MKLNLQPFNAQEMAVNQELDIDESKVEDLFQVLDSDEFPSNFQQIFIYQEEYFALLIKAIEIDDEKKVSRILHLTNQESINIAQIFNHGQTNRVIYPSNGAPANNEIIPYRKTLLIVAAQYSAHKSLQILLNYIRQHLTPVECAHFIYKSDDITECASNLTMVDIILNEPEYAKKVSPFDVLKKTIDLIPCGLTALPTLLHNPIYNLNFELIKYLVEERNADVNEGHDEDSETNIATILCIEASDDYDEFQPELKEKVRKVMAYMLERGAYVHEGNRWFLYTLQRTGSEELYQIVKPYKDQIDFSHYDPLDQISLFELEHRNQKSLLLEIKHLNRPIPPGGYDVYKKLLLMHGTESDFILAKEKFKISETDFVFNAIDTNQMIQFSSNIPISSEHKIFIKNIRHFSIAIPTESHDLFFKLILQAGSDDDLDHILNTLNIVPSVQWLQNNNPFNFCERVKQALLLKTKFEKHDLIRHIEHLPAFQSVQRYCTFFTRTANIPARGSARCGINMTALGAFKDCLLDSELLSLRETINFMQVSKAYYGDIETPTADTSLIPTP